MQYRVYTKEFCDDVWYNRKSQSDPVMCGQVEVILYYWKKWAQKMSHTHFTDQLHSPDSSELGQVPCVHGELCKWSDWTWSDSLAEAFCADVFIVLLAQMLFILGQCGGCPTGCSLKDIEWAGTFKSFWVEMERGEPQRLQFLLPIGMRWIYMCPGW